jgi:hypothetical protein
MLDGAVRKEPLSRSVLRVQARSETAILIDATRSSLDREPHWALGQNREKRPLLANSNHQIVIV